MGREGRNAAKRQRWIMGAVLLAAAVLLGASLSVYSKIVRNTRALAAQMIAEKRRAFEQVPALAASEADTLRTFLNAEHVERAMEMGVGPIADHEEALALLQQGKLVQIATNPYYAVQEMDYSVPYVTPHTSNLLTLIGMRFQQALQEQGLPLYRYVITSATRTVEDQERLRGVNGNAADTSSHVFGTTVDLHYQEFDYSPDQDSTADGFWISRSLLQRLLRRELSHLNDERQARLKAILGRVLTELQDEGAVLVIYERLQPVYHLTLGAPVETPPVPLPDSEPSGLPPGQHAGLPPS
jgi:hypothetical protein